MRQAVVGNPNTALEVLFILACEFPHEFLKNPILLLLHLSQPDFMKRIPPSTLLHLLRCNELTVYWLKQIQQMTQTFKEYGNTRSKLLEGITIRGEVSMELLAQEQDARILLRLARNPSASPNLLRQLAQSEDKEVRIAVARHKNAPSDVFLEMIDSLDRVTWPGLIRNPVVSRSILEQLSVSFDAVSYEEYELIDWLKLCWHPAMAAEQQQFIFSVFREKMKKVVLAYSPLSYSNHTYSKHVYFHMNSPEHIGALGPSKLRWKFLSQPDLPLPILELFACSVLWEERYLVTQHSAVTDTLLEQLAADGHAYVRAAARLAQKQKQR